MSDIVIRQVTHNVWTFSRPFILLGSLPVGGRSTAIKLATGDVWIFASTPLTDETKQKLAELGPVKYIIAGNLYHTMFLKQYKEAYPTAKLIGPEDINKKKGVAGVAMDRLDGVISAANSGITHGFEDEFEICYFTGYSNKDIAFFHKPSKTVVAADLLMNLPGHEQFSKSSVSPLSLLGNLLSPNARTMRWFIMWKAQDKAAMSRDAKTVHSWDFVRYIPCHGDIIETGAKAAWATAWSRYL